MNWVLMHAMREHALQNKVSRLGPRYVGEDLDPLLFIAWPAIEDMFSEDLTQLENESIDWLGLREPGFQYDTTCSTHLGGGSILWPTMPHWVLDGSACAVCQCPFRAKDCYLLGTCGSQFHPQCMLLWMMTKRWSNH